LLEYSPYGTTVTHTGTADPSHKFTGQEEDADSELYYYGARYYDPELGRFITPDWIVQDPSDPQSLNRYAYARNNPIKYEDPTGNKWSWGSFFKAFVAAFVAAVVTVALFPVLGPAAFVVGGAVGGAIHGGLNGGLKGALEGAAMGAVAGALVGLTGPAGPYFAAALLGYGIYQAAKTDSWDSFAGSILGGITGAYVGGKYVNFKQQQQQNQQNNKGTYKKDSLGTSSRQTNKELGLSENSDLRGTELAKPNVRIDGRENSVAKQTIENKVAQFLKRGENPQVTKLSEQQIRVSYDVRAGDVSGDFARYSKIISHTGETLKFQKAIHDSSGAIKSVEVKYQSPNYTES